MHFFRFQRAGKVVVPSVSDYDPVVHLSHEDCKWRVQSPLNTWRFNSRHQRQHLFWIGILMYLGRGSRTCNLCPVAAVSNYVVWRGSSPGPFFLFLNGNYLTREQFVTAGCRRYQLLTLCGTLFSDRCHIY